jgi:hypothetical protein
MVILSAPASLNCLTYFSGVRSSDAHRKTSLFAYRWPVGWEPEGDIGYKYTIHDVDVYPLCFTAIEHIYVPAQMGKISRQNRGRDYDTHGG